MAVLPQQAGTTDPVPLDNPQTSLWAVVAALPRLRCQPVVLMSYASPRHILLRRRTEAITDEAVVYFERALQKQLDGCAYFYKLPPCGVTYVSEDTILPSTEAVFIDLVDDDGLEAAVAHHGFNPGANFGWALVGVREVDDWTVAASHEALEYFLNFRLDRWAEAPDGSRWAYEICDPVQDVSYPVAVDLFGTMKVLRLSNYVLPAFWENIEPDDLVAFGLSEPVDYLAKLTAPFTLTPGGYAVVERDGQRTELGAGARRGRATNQARATARATARGASLLAAKAE